MQYEQWIKELAKDTLSPMKKEKTTTLDEIDKLSYGYLDEEDFFSISDRESMNNTKEEKNLIPS